MAKKYMVTGIYKGKNINEEVVANSIKQAKLKAGFKNGYGGSEMGPFMKSNKLKVKSM